MTPWQLAAVLLMAAGCLGVDLNISLRPTFVLSHPSIKLPSGIPDHLKPLTICNDRPFGIAGIKVPICETVWHFKRDQPPIRTCRIGKVNAATAEKLRAAYGGLLQPEKSADAMRGSGRGASTSHDGDMCCPTVRSIRKAPSVMMNSFGVARDIVSLSEDGLYQYYTAGTCLEDSNQMTCHGTCMQETTTVYLMVLRQDLPMTTSFEPFDVPSYCSCKNVGTSETKGRVAGRGPRPTNTTTQQTANTTDNSTPTPAQSTESSPMLNLRRTTVPKLTKSKTSKTIGKPKYSRFISAAKLRKKMRRKTNSPSRTGKPTVPTLSVNATTTPATNTSDVAV